MIQKRYEFIILAACVAVFWQVIGFEFLHFDDTKHIVENPFVAFPEWNSFRYLWTHDYFGLYIPVTYSFWAGITAIGRLASGPQGALAPGVYHTANLLLHAANTVLLYWLLRALFQAPSSTGESRKGRNEPEVRSNEVCALIGSLFFAIHPIQVESVAWISGVKDLLATFFSLLALNAVFAFPKHPRFALPAFVLALGSKPSAVTLPALAVLIAVFIRGEGWRSSLRRFGPWFVLSVSLAVFTKTLQPDAAMSFVPGLPQRPFVAGHAVTFYLAKIVWPFSSYFPEYGQSPAAVLGSAWIYAYWIIPAAILGLVWANRNHAPFLLAGYLFFGVALGPVLGIVPFGFQAFSTVTDHYAYFPLVGISMIVTGALCRFRKHEWFRQILVGATILVALCGLRSLLQVGVWRNDQTLFGHNLKHNPESYLSQTNLAIPYIAQGELDKALFHFKKAVEINPDYLPAQSNIGAIYLKQNRPSTAIRHLKEILEEIDDVDPSDTSVVAEMHNNLGVAYLQRSMFSEALPHFVQALEGNPGYFDAHMNAGVVFVHFEDWDKAVQQFETALAIRPGHPAAKNQRQSALAAKGRGE